MKIYYYLMLLLFLDCSNSEPVETVSFNWKKITKTNKPILFGQVDSILEGYIMSYSYSKAISGGFKIIKLDTSMVFSDSMILFESNKNTVPFVSVEDGNIGFVQNDFEENTLKSKFFYSNDLGQIWNEIKTPLKGGVRKSLLTETGFIVEGNLDGTGQVFRSMNKEISWSKINFLKNGYKDFYILNNDTINILGKGSKTYSSKDTRLVLFNLKNGNIKELLNFDDEGGFGYINPISKNKDLHVIVDGRKLKVYSLQNEEINQIEEFKLPNQTQNRVEAIFLAEKYFIVTVREERLYGKLLSWISYNKGKDWSPFEHEKEFRLIDCSFGGLFVTDKENNILMEKTSRVDSLL